MPLLSSDKINLTKMSLPTCLLIWWFNVFGGVTWWPRGLRIQHCHGCGSGHCCDMGSIPGPETSTCWGMAKLKKKNCFQKYFGEKCSLNKQYILCSYKIKLLKVNTKQFFVCLFAFLPFFQGRSRSIWRFPGQESNHSCCRQPTPQPQQLGIRATSATYTTAHGNARSLTH